MARVLLLLPTATYRARDFLAAARRERTARIQGTSQQNTFMRQPTNPDWVYGYDAWTAPLPEYV